MINDLQEPGFSSCRWRLALETMKTQGETQGEDKIRFIGCIRQRWSNIMWLMARLKIES